MRIVRTPTRSATGDKNQAAAWSAATNDFIDVSNYSLCSPTAIGPYLFLVATASTTSIQEKDTDFRLKALIT